MHVHTLYSVDAYFFNGLNGPREAYRFAKGEPESLPVGETDPYTAGRTIQLDRPRDFAAVHDNSDFLVDWRLLCQVDGALPIGIHAASHEANGRATGRGRVVEVVLHTSVPV